MIKLRWKKVELWGPFDNPDGNCIEMADGSTCKLQYQLITSVGSGEKEKITRSKWTDVQVVDDD